MTSDGVYFKAWQLRLIQSFCDLQYTTIFRAAIVLGCPRKKAPSTMCSELLRYIFYALVFAPAFSARFFRRLSALTAGGSSCVKSSLDILELFSITHTSDTAMHTAK